MICRATLGIVMLLLTSTFALGEGTQLTAAQMKADFIGKKHHGSSLTGDPFTWIWNADGTGSGTYKGNASNAFYKIKGNQFCTGGSPKKTTACHTLWLMPDGTIQTRDSGKAVSNATMD